MKKFLSVLLAVMMVLSTVSFAAPSLAGTADTAVEMPVVDVPAVEEETAALAAEISGDVDSYGELIFELNFDNLSSVSTQIIKFTEAGFVSPSAEQYNYLSDAGKITFSDWPTYSIKERAAGDKYLELSGGTGYAVTLLNSGTDRGFQTKDGVYTLTADVYRPDAMPFTTRFSGGSSEDTPIQDFSDLNDAGWGSVILQHDPSCFGNGGHANPFTSIADAKTIKLHRNGGTDAKTVGYDNIRLYYKPLTVNVTVKASGKSVTVPVSTAAPVTVSSLFDELGLGVLYSLTGAKVGEKTYNLSDSILFGADTTVELTVEKVDDKYVHPTHGLMLYDIDFEKAEIGTEIPASNANFNIGAYATPIAHKVMSHTPDNWHLNSSGISISVMADPKNPSNKVAGSVGATNTGYPMLKIDTYSNGLSARYGFVEDDDIIWTIEYNYYDTKAGGIALRFGGKSSISEQEGYAKWTTVEDTCNESSNGRVASAWYTNTGVMPLDKYSRMGGSDEISFVKMHAAAPNNADLYWDNVRLYYKPAHVDLTISANGMDDVTIATPTLTNTSTSYKVSDLLAAAGVDYSAVSSLSYVFRGVSLDAEGTTVYGLDDTIGFIEDCTVYLIFDKIDMSEWQDEHGILLFDIDFEDSRAASVLTANTNNKDYYLTEFAKVNPYIAGTEKWAFSTSGMDMIGIENGAVKLQWDGTGKWPQILIGNPTNNAASVLIGENGTYYVHAEYKVLGSLDPNLASIAVTANGLKNGVHQTSTGILSLGNSFYTSSNQVLVNEWMTIEGGKSTWVNDVDGLDNDDINKITTVFTHNATTSTPGGYYLMDNIKLWWKPSKVDVTIVGGQNADFETVTLKDVSTASTMDQLIALIPGATSDFGKITGFATEDGEKLSTLSFSSDVTLQALWSPFVVVAGGQEFATDAKGVSGGGSGQWSGAYGNTDEVGDGGGQVTGAISWMYGNGWYTAGGNLFQVQDTVAIGENNAGGTTATWATPAVHSINDMIRENINTTLAASNDAEYVLIKYRYDNLPNLAEVYANDPNPDGKKYTLSADGKSLTYYGRTGTTQYTFEMAPDYGKKYYIQLNDNNYQYGGGQEYHQNELMVEDVWYYDLLPFTALMNTNGVKCVIVQTYNRFDGQITEYDYVRFVKLGDELAPVVPEEPAPEYAPKTFDTVSYRLNAPNGLRFKAEITEAINLAASDYGWVVGRAAKGATEETLVIGADNVITAYGRENNVDLKSFFEQEDDIKRFTAVIYNIPAGNEDDVLCIKPFVKVEGVVYYGNMISVTPRQVADASGIDVSLLMKK